MLQFLTENKASNEELGKIKGTVPPEFAKFLLNQNGGQLVKLPIFKRLLNDTEQEMAIEYFYRIDQINSVIENLQYEENFKNLLPIAATLGAAIVCIGNSDVNMGKIYIIDWDFGVTFQANNLEEFLEQLQKDTEI